MGKAQKRSRARRERLRIGRLFAMRPCRPPVVSGFEIGRPSRRCRAQPSAPICLAEIREPAVFVAKIAIGEGRRHCMAFASEDAARRFYENVRQSGRSVTLVTVAAETEVEAINLARAGE